MRSSSRRFHRPNSSAEAVATGGRRSSAANTDTASGSVSTTSDSDRLAPVTATAAATSSGSSARSLAACGWATDQPLQGEPAGVGRRRPLDRLLDGAHPQSVARLHLGGIRLWAGFVSDSETKPAQITSSIVPTGRSPGPECVDAPRPVDLCSSP